jgi:hypothetical protein
MNIAINIPLLITHISLSKCSNAMIRPWLKVKIGMHGENYSIWATWAYFSISRFHFRFTRRILKFMATFMIDFIIIPNKLYD